MQFIVLWAACLFAIGLAFMPLSGWIFRKFEDRGWLFSKALGLLLCGSALWALNVSRLIPFTGKTCLGMLAAFACVNWGAYFVCGRRARNWDIKPRLKTVLVEEAILLLYYLLCVYIVGFVP